MFTQGTVSGNKYPDTLQQFMETQLRNDGISDTVAFQQDRAPAHSVNAVQENLYNTFHDRWRGTASSGLWAIFPPDFMCTFFFAWCFIKAWRYKTKLNNMHELQKCIHDATELHQQCYSEYSEHSWNIGNTALKWRAAINILLQLQ